ncbi:TonB-dependent receptor [Novosphingobium sp.]|uniref:TonB-dependent receptor n=1 Tax=Novosphingobium sp. TaxID=1874826 RepID=UPI003D14693E
MTHAGKRALRRCTMLTAATFLSPLVAGTAFAQATPADTPDAASVPVSSGLGDIVVTATRKSESLQKVPISLQALSMDKLEQHQVSNFNDYIGLLPSVSSDSLGPGRSNLFFRGISVGGGGLPTAATYLDEIPITSSGGMPEVHIYDVERVEALSGPQGTLFGSSSLAGTLRIITQKPKLDKIEAGIDAQVDAFGHGGGAGSQIQGYLNLPITHTVALRVMAFYDHEGGYINNTPGSYLFTFGQYNENSPPQVYNNGTFNPAISYYRNNASVVQDNYNPVTQYGGRATLLWQVTPDWSIMPSITYQHLQSYGGFGYDPRFTGLQVHDYTPTSDHDEWYQASLTLQGHIAGLDVTGSLGYFHRDTHIQQDYSYYAIDYDKNGGSYYYFRGPDGNILDPMQSATSSTASHKITEELRVSTPRSSRLQLTAGIFNQFQKNLVDTDYIQPGGATGYLGTDYDGRTGVFLPTDPAPAIRGNALYATDLNQTYKDFGIYAEGSYPILDTLKLTGGIRYFSTSNNTYGFNGVLDNALALGCTTPLTGRLQCINVNEPYHQTGQTHKVSLAWQVEPDKMLYATYSTGFRPGGGNNLTGSQPYKADTIDNFELGAKIRIGRNFRFNTAVYYEKWKGVQYSVVVPNTYGSAVTINAGNARVYGVEGDFDWKLGPITFSGSAAYNDAKLSTNFCDLVALDNLVPSPTCSVQEGNLAAASGTRLPRQPKFKGQLTARYDVPINSSWNAYLQAVASHQSSSTSDLNTANDALFGDPAGFQSFDFTAGVKHDTYTLEAFIQNAFDSRGVLSRNAFCEIQTCTEGTRSYPIKPRYFGVRASKKF